MKGMNRARGFRRAACGETDVAEETLREIIAGAGLNPLDGYVRDCLMDAINDALHALPAAQRRVVEAQVFGGLTFREIAESTGESIDTGVVNHCGEVWNYPGLFVADGSVIPTALSVNPSMTIGAIAERTAFWMLNHREMGTNDPNKPRMG